MVMSCISEAFKIIHYCWRIHLNPSSGSLVVKYNIVKLYVSTWSIFTGPVTYVNSLHEQHRT